MSLEHKLISSLIDPAEMTRIYDMGLKPEVFEDPLNRYVYQFVIDYWLSSQMTAVPTQLAIETERPGFRLELGVEEESWWLAEQLMKRFASNGIQEMVRQAASTCNQDPVGTLKQLQSAAYEASEVVTPRHSRSDMSDYEARRRRYRDREEGREAGMTLGLGALDEHTGGILPGELCAVGAFSKVGKTVMLLHAAAAAHRAGHTPIVFSLEMPIEEIEDRLDALLSGVSYNRLSRRKLTVHELQRLHEYQELMMEGGSKIYVESPEEGERTVAHLTARARHVGANYLIVDQLSFMEETIRTNSEKQRQASILKQLKNEIGRASRKKLPCLLAVQLKRETLDRADGPRIDDFADAAEVERTSDLLLGLSRNKEMLANRVMKLSILGGRRCDTASYLLKWDLVDRTHIEIMERVNR